jgi:hypothetical protein
VCRGKPLTRPRASPPCAAPFGRSRYPPSPDTTPVEAGSLRRQRVNKANLLFRSDPATSDRCVVVNPETHLILTWRIPRPARLPLWRGSSSERRRVIAGITSAGPVGRRRKLAGWDQLLAATLTPLTTFALTMSPSRKHSPILTLSRSVSLRRSAPPETPTRMTVDVDVGMDVIRSMPQGGTWSICLQERM